MSNMTSRFAFAIALLALPLMAQTAKKEVPPPTVHKEITDTDRFKIRELEARLLQVDNQVKDWQLTGRPKAQEEITKAYQEAQTTCKTGEQLNTNTIKCEAPLKEEKTTAKKEEEK